MKDLSHVPSALLAGAEEMEAQQNVEAAAKHEDAGLNAEGGPQAGGMQRVAPSLRSSAALAETNYMAGVIVATSPAGMSADELIPMTISSTPQFPVLHPQGFRILKNSSVMERNMRGYFRLPQPPNSATRKEQLRLQRTLWLVEREEAERKARITGNQDGVVLDGFLLLSACEADDPEEVTAVTLQASQLTSSVQEDLPFFTELKMLDVSDNHLHLGDVLPFPHLETVHLVCNSVSSLADVVCSNSPSLFTLMALDLAYNRIPPRDLLYLSAFRALKHLDLSNNGLRSLPADLSSLSQLTHLALESNQLASAHVFHALGTLPALLAVNLTNNRLSQVPLLHAPHQLETNRAGDEHPVDDAPCYFPSIQTMCLSSNRFTDLEALVPLAALHRTLRHIAVGNNPFLSSQPQAAARRLQRALDEAVVDLYFIAKDSAPPLVSADMTASLTGANTGTWRGKTWVRYLSPRPQYPENQDDELTQSRTSSLETAAPKPSTAAEEEPWQYDDIPPADFGESANEPQNVREEDARYDAHCLTVEEYLGRYHISVQCATQPPPPPKQPKRYFYSSAYRASQEGMQNATPLVTLPLYAEFMDIYRITGRRGHTLRRKGHPAPLRRRGKLSLSAPTSSRSPVLPVVARQSFTSPPTSATAHSSLPENDHSDGDDEEEDDGDVAQGESPEYEDGVFLTGVNSEGGRFRGGRRKWKSAPKSAEERGTESEEIPAEKTAGEIIPDAHAARAGRANNAFPASQSTVPRPPLPRLVLSPSSTNVHTAISELRSMLRKPLPSLPYEDVRSRQAH
ncbi:hypothetical protein ABL78_1268 [Leptomonas seymouri]|uniref:Leucine-rich repeat protein n=1 Tax=Leptomonas seymouri TaxID=5684 RepID=A0A0N1I2F9_LEPSE|nr:hypothetical protein ABL78_1268 [Leptomonas seymouri]|eukprot:KPI89603.1 hypothetical protein ABL78_1268 [Leptomonas seymouri]